MKYIFGNWKMYLDYRESVALAQALAQTKFNNKKIELAVFPSALSLKEVMDNLQGTAISLGSQDHTWHLAGAYTGALSARMFKELGCKYALCGHSERRHVFGDTDEEVRKKIEEALNVDLTPVVCIGETQEDRKAGKRQYRLKKQLLKAFENLNLNSGKVIIAYEPVWAISKAGAGEPCLPPEADDVQGWIKQEFKKYFSIAVPVLYGGSVDAKNVLAYLSQPMIDGVLVGNASTKAGSLFSLIRETEKF